MLFTVQAKCARLIGATSIDAKYRQLNKDRENAFIAYFKDKEVANRVRISAGVNVIPYNGFSYYKIVYKGEYPEALTKAYKELNDLNDEAPRNIFKKLRDKIKAAL